MPHAISHHALPIAYFLFSGLTPKPRKQPVTLGLDLRLNGGRDSRGGDGIPRAGIDGLRRGGDVATDVLGLGDRGEGAEVRQLAARLGRGHGAVAVEIRIDGLGGFLPECVVLDDVGGGVAGDAVGAIPFDRLRVDDAVLVHVEGGEEEVAVKVVLRKLFDRIT